MLEVRPRFLPQRERAHPSGPRSRHGTDASLRNRPRHGSDVAPALVDRSITPFIARPWARAGSLQPGQSRSAARDTRASRVPLLCAGPELEFADAVALR